MESRTDISAALVVGYGEVGRAIAGRLTDAGVRTVLVDPIIGSNEHNAPVKATIPADLGKVDIAFAAVPSSASLSVAREVARCENVQLHIDFSSSSQALMRQCAEEFAGRPATFIDAAIMGSVDLAGADMPMTLAGSRAGEVAETLGRFGFQAFALRNSSPGDASGLKLLRSILMKGIEAVAIECYAVANCMGLDSELRDNLSDVGAKPFPDLLDAMVRTHIIHAPRRSHEVAAALDQARDAGLELPVSRAVHDAYRRTTERLRSSPQQPPGNVVDAVTWLSESMR